MFSMVRLDRAALFWADGPLGGAEAPGLHSALEAAITDGAKPVVVDLVSVPGVDEGVVAVLAAAADRLGHAGQSLELRLARGRRFKIKNAFELRTAIAQGYPSAA
ncbi:STAS domain-containing protein [Actinoplanes sp. NPDC049548]|uniref:STAS domain-containing protein n=1 Tax=Actinoplanes sp. NPDC049548 TaxID=3155152 RepID=UPI003416F27B